MTAPTLNSTASTAFRAALDTVAAVEPRIAAAIGQELADQRESLKLIASENYASPAVLLAMGNWLSDKYAEGTIGHRFYAGCQNVDTVESRRRRARPRAVRRARTPTCSRTPASTPTSSRTGPSWPPASRRRRWSGRARRTSTTCPRPTGRSCAASSATSGCSACRWTPAATSPTASGPTSPARCSSRPATAPTRTPGCSTTTRSREQAREFKPLILVAGYSAYPRRINFATMREIADEVGATLMVDMAHFAGLVAGRRPHRRREPGAVRPRHHHTTHKSLRGPRGGMVLCTDELRAPSTGAARWCSAGRCRTSWRPRPSPSPRPAPHAFRGLRARGSSTTPRRWPTACCAAARRSSPAAPTTTWCCSTSPRLRPHRPAGRGGAARRRPRHQPQRDPAGPERRLVHLRHPARHARR